MDEGNDVGNVATIVIEGANGEILGIKFLDQEIDGINGVNNFTQALQKMDSKGIDVVGFND